MGAYLNDYITVVTAIIGTVLGIINLVLIIHKESKNNINIYNEDMSIDCCLSCTKGHYRGKHLIIPLEVSYELYIINNKNRVAFIKWISWCFSEKNQNYYINTLSHPKSLNFSVDSHSTKKIVDNVEIELYIDKEKLDENVDYFFHFISKLRILIDDKIYKKDVSTTLFFTK